MRTLLCMADVVGEAEVDAELPGEPLESGFRFRKSRDAPGGMLSKEARQRVIAKMDSVDQARLRAARDGHTAYIG